MMRSFVICTLH